MLERFTDDVVLAIVSARDLALELGHGHLGSEHLLLGLLAANRGGATAALARNGVTLSEARQCTCSIVTPAAVPRPGPLRFTATAKRALEWSRLESAERQSTYVTPEDLLLGVIRADGTAVAVLVELGVDIRQLCDDLRNRNRAPVLPRADRRGPVDVDSLFIDLLRASDDVTTVALDALVASWAGDAEGLEARTGELVRLIEYLGGERWLAQLEDMVEIIDAEAGEVRIRPRPDPQG